MRSVPMIFGFVAVLIPCVYGDEPPEQSFFMHREQSEITEIWSFRCIFGYDHAPLCTGCTRGDANEAVLWKMVRASRHDRESFAVEFVQAEGEARLCVIMHVTGGPAPEIERLQGTLTAGDGTVVAYEGGSETEPAACAKNPRRPGR
jgi:hypothetical protein